MVRVDDGNPLHIRFERQERDGREHGRWVLQAVIRDLATRDTSMTHLSITLHYEGRLWSAVVERVLADEIDRSKDRLRNLVVAVDVDEQ